MKTAREVIDDQALVVGMVELLRTLAEGDGMSMVLILYDGQSVQMTTNFENRDTLGNVMDMIANDIRDRPADRVFVAPKPS